VLRLDHHRCKGNRERRATTAIGPSGRWPDIDTQGSELAPGALDEAARVDLSLWQKEFDGMNT